jgi:two-component system chemotaxis response regulator CheY
MDRLEFRELIQGLETEVDEFDSSRRPRILVVEDEEMCSLRLQTALDHYGDCEVARTGRQALQAYRSALEEGRPFDLICLDIRLPDLDGGEVLRKLRQYEAVTGERSGVKVVVVSGIRDSEKVLDMYRIGCQGYLMKPFKVESLLNRLSDLEVIR